MLQVQKPRRIWPLRLLSWLFDVTPRWLHFTAVALAVAAVVLTFQHGHFIKTEVKAWQSRRMVAEAKELLKEEITQREGVQLLLEAWQLSPEEPDVMRALARASSEIGLPHYARFFYTQLPRFEALTPEDELDFASALTALLGPQISTQFIFSYESFFRQSIQEPGFRGLAAMAMASSTLVLPLLFLPQSSDCRQDQHPQRRRRPLRGQHRARCHLWWLLHRSWRPRDPRKSDCWQVTCVSSNGSPS